MEGLYHLTKALAYQKPGTVMIRPFYLNKAISECTVTIHKSQNTPSNSNKD